ncbi:hypothetical protein ATCC90586_010173 [Pythium insidiosum]|nr:hypothetical protein ATCC90586_010173 [Pythium insidiosum]
MAAAENFLQRTLLLLALGVTAACGVYFFFASAPEAQFQECEAISISYVISGVLPTWMNGRNDKMGTVKGLWACAEQYKQHHPGFVLASFCVVYIVLQTFAIPGPIVLSILSGAMYPFWHAQALVAFCATTGASLEFPPYFHWRDTQ